MNSSFNKPYMTGKELWYVDKTCALEDIASDAFNDERIRMGTRLDTSHGNATNGTGRAAVSATAPNVWM